MGGRSQGKGHTTRFTSGAGPFPYAGRNAPLLGTPPFFIPNKMSESTKEQTPFTSFRHFLRHIVYVGDSSELLFLELVFNFSPGLPQEVTNFSPKATEPFYQSRFGRFLIILEAFPGVLIKDFTAAVSQKEFQGCESRCGQHQTEQAEQLSHNQG